MSLTRIGYASLNVHNIAASERHYTEIAGLRVTGRDAQGRVYLQAPDAQDHHCLVLNPAGRPGLDHAGYKVNDPGDLEVARVALEARGVKCRRMPDGELEGQGEGLLVRLPTGHELALYFHADKVGYAAGMRNPDPVLPEPRTGVTHLDHVVLACADPGSLGGLLQETLGFYVTEQAYGPNGQPLAVFLTCSHKMHDLALVAGPEGRFHHLAFGVESRFDVIARTDALKRHGIPTIEIGLSRHGIAGVTTVYCRDPSGNQNEFMNGAYLAPGAANRVPPVIWEGPAAMRGLFYYESSAPPSMMTATT